jgi:peptidoglycan/xylan/chitin deacetylase (PgdA/CDA1 family)
MNLPVVPVYGLLQWLTAPWLHWQKPAGGRQVYLTFDDGPHPEVTPRVLDILERHGARATFFLLGRHAARYPALTARIRASGHRVGNHGQEHLNGWLMPAHKVLDNAERGYGVTGSRLFRPPFGRLGPSQAKALYGRGFQTWMWSVSSRDYDARQSPEDCLRRTLSRTTDGSVVLFHDSPLAAGNCLYVLPRLLEQLSAGGHAFKTL